MAAKNLTLYVAEKPSAARDLAAYLAEQHLKGSKYRSEGDGAYYTVGDDIAVWYPRGHIVQQDYPEAYLTPEQNKADFFTYGPVIPTEWKSHPRAATDRSGKPVMKNGKPCVDPQWTHGVALIKRAKKIINAGDIGREGQLIFDEVFTHQGIDPTQPHFERLAMIDGSAAGLKKAFAAMTKNGDPFWQNLRAAAETRQNADWVIGMNASRAYQSVFRLRTLSMGRVQLPVLNMVVMRDRLIENFVRQPYYTPIVILTDGMEMRWKARKDFASQAGFDPNGRIIVKALAEQIVRAIQSSAVQGITKDLKSQKKSKKPPLGFTFASLQTFAAKKLGCTLKQVADAAQSLYDKKCITYVGTDVPYYPETMLADVRQIMKDLSPMFGKLMAGADSSKQPESFNIKNIGEKVVEHFAIAPNGTMPPSNMTEIEKGVFDIVTRRFAAQFYPDYQYTSIAVVGEFGADTFEAATTKVTNPGWKVAEGIDADSDDEGEGGGVEVRVEREKDDTRHNQEEHR